MKKGGLFVVFLSGLLFSVGLGISGMTDARKVVAFLDLGGAWDPALALVMVGAIATHGLLRRFILRRPKPVFTPFFPEKTQKAIDWRLVVGATIFGFGWALGGFCPAPSIVVAGTGEMSAFWHTGAMLLGVLLYELRFRAVHKEPVTIAHECA